MHLSVNAIVFVALSAAVAKGRGTGAHNIANRIRDGKSNTIGSQHHASDGVFSSPIENFESEDQFWTHHFLQEIISMSVTFEPSSEPSTRPSVQPSTSPSSEPSTSPSASPSASPSSSPSERPSTAPSTAPSSYPTSSPSASPSESPSVSPSSTPSSEPTSEPSASPSASPSSSPSATPTGVPSATPSVSPNREPSSTPSDSPTTTPSASPSSEPTSTPSVSPTSEPSASPSSSPSSSPSTSPSSSPSSSPSTSPSSSPSASPSSLPTAEPSAIPTAMPSSLPTSQPTFEKCNLSKEERAFIIIETLKTVSDPIDLETPGTPQNNALVWLLDLDEYCVCPDQKFVQRYVMAVFYYSTDGGNWNECNAPSNFSDPVEIADANADCTIVGDGPDAFGLPIFQGTDAWLTPSYECFWGGLACLNATECMDRIEFERDGLAGTLPFELQNLTELRFLIVEEGNTAGTIPTEYGTFRTLHILDLNFNDLTGPIPIQIYDLELSLFQLDLNDNFLTGTIATEIGNILFLQFLQVEANRLTGTIPSELGRSNPPNQLRVAEFFTNQLTGFMPQEVCDNRNTSSGFIYRLTCDCDDGDPFYVNCSVPECCTDCPF